MKKIKHFIYILGIGTLTSAIVNAFPGFVSCPQVDCSKVEHDLICIAQDPFHFERETKVANLGDAFQPPVTLKRAVDDQTCEYSIGNGVQFFRVKKLPNQPLNNPCTVVSDPSPGFNCQ